MKIVINSKFSNLNFFIESVPNIFSKEGITIYKERNELKCYSTEGLNIVVKHYKKPHLFNRIAYTFFRQSKAKRAYEYALKLFQLGVESPTPIAYIEKYTAGLLSDGYFVSIYENDYSDIRKLMDGTQRDEVLLKELSLYIADLHCKGVLHLDLSPGNILYKKDKNKISFKLIDINRMKFLSTISNEKKFKSLKRLSENNDVLTDIAKFYALASHLNEKESIEKINKYSSEFLASREKSNTRKHKVS